MYTHILIPTDGSELAERAINRGMELARSIHAKVTVMTVSPTFKTFAAEAGMGADAQPQYARACEARVQKRLAFGVEAARAAGVLCETVHVIDDHPYQAILDVAAKNMCDLIFMAPHGHRGVIGLVLGGETTRVLTHGKVSVLVCR